MYSAVLRVLLAMVVLVGTLAPSIEAAADAVDGSGCSADSDGLLVAANGAHTDPRGDCQTCAPGCLCACCALRCGAVFSVPYWPVVLSFVVASPVAPAHLHPLLAVADIFHPPRA